MVSDKTSKTFTHRIKNNYGLSPDDNCPMSMPDAVRPTVVSRESKLGPFNSKMSNAPQRSCSQNSLNIPTRDV